MMQRIIRRMMRRMLAVFALWLLLVPLPAQAAQAAQEKATAQQLLQALRKAETAQQAEETARRLRALWLKAGPVSALVLLAQASRAQDAGLHDLARRQLDLVVRRWPRFAEGWLRRAFLRFEQGDEEGALADVAQALARNPDHFMALALQARLLREAGRPRAALASCRRLLRIHPQWRRMRTFCRELRLSVEQDV